MIAAMSAKSNSSTIQVFKGGVQQWITASCTGDRRRVPEALEDSFDSVVLRRCPQSIFLNFALGCCCIWHSALNLKSRMRIYQSETRSFTRLSFVPNELQRNSDQCSQLIFVCAYILCKRNLPTSTSIRNTRRIEYVLQSLRLIGFGYHAGINSRSNKAARIKFR